MNPYSNLGEKFFWSTAVAKRNMLDIDGLWNPKFKITKRHRVATYGSCFAQHLGKGLRDNGFHWLITESAPARLSADNAKKFNYGVFSARTGNIYTVSLLRQWVNWATGDSAPPDEVWTKDGRFYDPFRPNIEPNGFLSAEEVVNSREMAIEAFDESLKTASIFVFTLGLTESWVNEKAGYEYAMCPGTVAGEFDAGRHKFVNQDYAFIGTTLIATIKKIRALNPKIRFLLTVSPVPLTATMSGNHVLVATMESKSILRAVAAQAARQFDFVDYFPSYEIINATPFRGSFFEPNQRHVSRSGVDHVMKTFFTCLNAAFPEEIEPEQEGPAAFPEEAASEQEGLEAAVRRKQKERVAALDPAARRQARIARKKRAMKLRRGKPQSQEDTVCEEELLDAFAKRA